MDASKQAENRSRRSIFYRSARRYCVDNNDHMVRRANRPSIGTGRTHTIASLHSLRRIKTKGYPIPSSPQLRVSVQVEPFRPSL